MSVLVIGGDRIEPIRKKLISYGFNDISYILKRKKKN